MGTGCTRKTNQVVRELIHQFVLDEDYNVPDSRDDVSKVVALEGKVQIEEVKPVENYVRVQGRVEFQILYVAEGFEPKFCSMEGKIPFVEMIYMEGTAEKVPEVKKTHVELTAQMIHSRKLRVRSMVEMELLEERQRAWEIPTDVVSEGMLYKKQSPMEILKLHTSKKDIYRVKEEINLPGTKESVGVMLWTDVASRKMDTRPALDELQIMGELLLFCFYESPDGKIDWLEQTIPYQGRVSCNGIDETMYHHVRANLEEVHVEVREDEDGEMRVIGVEGTLQLYIAVYEEEKMDFLEDLYSLEQNCVIETKPVDYEQLVLMNHSKCKVMERLSIPELRNEVLQICHSKGILRIDRMERRDDGIQMEGALYISFLYVKANDQMPFDIWQGVVPVSYLIECGDADEKVRYHISAALEQLSITLQGGDEIEVKAVLAFQGFFKRVETREMIWQVKTEPMVLAEIEKRPSIVGYIVKEGDNLWSLAKRYSTSVEAICEVNEMSEETLQAGDRLLIFKENMSIL